MPIKILTMPLTKKTTPLNIAKIHLPIPINRFKESEQIVVNLKIRSSLLKRLIISLSFTKIDYYN